MRLNLKIKPENIEEFKKRILSIKKLGYQKLFWRFTKENLLVFTDDLKNGLEDLFCALLFDTSCLCSEYTISRKQGDEEVTLKFDEHYETLMYNINSISDSCSELKLFLSSDKQIDQNSKKKYLTVKMNNKGEMSKMSFKNRAEIKLAQIDVKYILQFFNEEETQFTFWCMTKNWIKILDIAAKEEMATEFKLNIKNGETVQLQLKIKELGMLIKFTEGIKVERITEEFKSGEKEFKFKIHHYYSKRLSTLCQQDPGASISIYKTGDLLMDLFYMDNNDQIVDRQLLIIPKTFDLDEEEDDEI